MYFSNETLTEVNSLPYDQNEPSQTESHLNLQLNLALQEKEAATEMLKLSQMTLNNLEDVLDERRKSCSEDYIKTVKADYSEAIQLLNNKVDALMKQITRLQEENHQYKTLNRDLESDYQLLRERNGELELEVTRQIQQAEEMIVRDQSHEIMTSTLLSLEAVTQEKQELVAKLKQLELEKLCLREKCTDLETTGDQMEEALRSSETKLREYKQKEAQHLEAIEAYVKDVNDMKAEIQNMNLKLQEQKMENKERLFEVQQEMSAKIADLSHEKSALLSEKACLQNEISRLSHSLDQLTERMAQIQTSCVDRDLYEKLQHKLSDVKQEKLFYQNESAQAMSEVECLNNKLGLDSHSYSRKVQLLEAQLNSQESVLQESSLHIQHLTEENFEYARELMQLRSQLGCYHKLFEKNSLLSTIEKFHKLEEDKQSQVAEFDAFIDKYRDQMRSWKMEWQRMTTRFEHKLNHVRSENESLRQENSLLRKHSKESVKCKIKKNDVT